jgi:hypothetical protein
VPDFTVEASQDNTNGTILHFEDTIASRFLRTEVANSYSGAAAEDNYNSNTNYSSSVVVREPLTQSFYVSEIKKSELEGVAASKRE